jgi:isocitrate dehydrogenase
MNKIKVKSPIVEIDGDEMAHLIWQLVKEKLILPNFEVELETYDLGIKNRDATRDRVTIEAAEAVMRRGVGVKCPTITPTEEQAGTLGLSQQWASPNATIRAMLDGTLLRRPIMLPCVTPQVRSWHKPIVLARHAYGGIQPGNEIDCWGPGRVELIYAAANGIEEKRLITELRGPGVVMALHNDDHSIRNFARTCFTEALRGGMSVWFGLKASASKIYHGRFADIFAEEFEPFRERFASAGIEYWGQEIDHVLSRVVRSDGGILWACMNYDGDLFYDLIAAGFGSHALMTSELASPNEAYLFESAHGTITRHYERYLDGEPMSSNPIATIAAWTGALRRRGELDGTPEVSHLAEHIDHAVLDIVNDNVMTDDLRRLCGVTNPEPPATTEEFIDAAAARVIEFRSTT